MIYTPFQSRVRGAAALSGSMPTGGFYRTPLTKPSCKLSRAVLDSDKDGAKQVPPKGPQAQLHLHLWGLGFGGSWLITLSEAPG